jgi:uncharacterized repeat protein (TIGR03806 family)
MQKTTLALLVLLFAASCDLSHDSLRAPVTLFPADAAPARLSEWGVVFADGRELYLNDAVLPYDLNMPLFSDYALKLRSIWLPPGSTATYQDEGPLDFPVGTIISKTFHYEKAINFSADNIRVTKTEREAILDAKGRLDLNSHFLIETRLLIRYDEGWKALPYVWNSEQNEAFLELAGDIKKIELLGSATDAGSFLYVVPDVNQCAGCHTTDHSAKLLQPIGPKAWQLNRNYEYGGESLSQLRHWQKSGRLELAAGMLPAMTDWSQKDAENLERRARAYLDANCAHCHNGDGAADTSGLDLALETTPGRDYGLCKSPVAVGRGSGDRPYDIYPGRPEDSIMVFRMQHTDPAIAMPELGRSTTHTEGVALIAEWIASLPGTC